jgi:AcrR family transcriptional regulator
MKDSGSRDIRSSILDATDRLLSRKGYKKMTIDELASEVGIGKGSVYLHFASKEEIVLSHIDRIIERLKARLDTIAAKRSPCAQRLKEMMIERVVFRFDGVQHYTQSLNDVLSEIRPNLLERRKRHFEEEARIFERLIKEGIESGEFDPLRPGDAARSLLLATNSLLPYSLSTRELGERREIEKRVSTLADMLLKGLVSRTD